MVDMFSFLNKNKSVLIILLAFGIYGCQINGNSDNTPSDPILPIDDWTVQLSGTSANFSDIYFYNENAGWVVGEANTILSTTNGGSNWPEAPVNSYEGNFRSVHLLSESNGWIAGDKNGAANDGYIYYSSNGGAYPEARKIVEYPMNAVCFLDENRGWAGGENGQLLYTTDAGITWDESVTDLDFSVVDIDFVDQQKGWAVGTEGNIVRSFDGGITWQNEYSDPAFDLLSVHFIDSLSGWACGTNNTILSWEEINGSMQWSRSKIDNEVASHVWHDIFFIDKQNGWIVGDGGAVYTSADGGKTWDKESTGVTTNLNAIHMISGSKGWIAGDEGVILTYTPLP